MPALVPWILAVAVFLDQLDSSALTTVLPVIAQDFGVSPMVLKLALTSYILAMALTIPICGWLARRFGAKRVFRAALLVFMAGSLGCAFSASLPVLVGARFVQGMGAAAMVPVARIIIVRGVPREGLVRALAWWTMPAMAAPILGPLVGGALASWASWHWIFLINIPVGLTGWVLSGIHLADERPSSPPPLDITGLLTATTCLSSLILGMSVIGSALVPAGMAGSLIALGILAGGLHTLRSIQSPHPLINLRLLSGPALRAAICGGFVFRMGTGAVHFLMPLLLQLGFGLSALQSGLLTFSGAIGAVVSKSVSQTVYREQAYGRVLLVVGIATGVLQASAALFQPGIPGWIIIAYMGLGGLLRSTFFAGVSAMGYDQIANEHVSDVSVLASVSNQLATGCGITLAGLLLSIFTEGSQAEPDLVALQWALGCMGALSGLAALCFRAGRG